MEDLHVGVLALGRLAVTALHCEESPVLAKSNLALLDGQCSSIVGLCCNLRMLVERTVVLIEVDTHLAGIVVVEWVGEIVLSRLTFSKFGGVRQLPRLQRCT